MRNQSLTRYALLNAPVPLPKDFPLVFVPYRNPDDPIVHLHRHDCLEVGYCHSGSGVFVVENKVCSYSNGDLIVVNETEAHLASSSRGTRSEWSFIQFAPAKFAPLPIDDPAVFDTAPLGGAHFSNLLHGREHPELAATILRIIDELRHRGSHYQMAVRGDMIRLMVQLSRLTNPLAENVVDKTTEKSTAMRRVAPALNMIINEYANQLAVGALAKTCHLSEAQFRRVFKTATGLSPKQYVINVRVRMAASMLRSTDDSVLDVSSQVGFETLSSFNRHFKSIMNSSPRQWRKTNVNT